MKKKVLGLVLALAMTLTLAAPAFAANYYTNQTDSSDLEQSVTFNALTFVPTIKLAAPTFTDSPIVLNPYKIQFTNPNKLAGQAIATTAENDQYKQVICPVYAIKNQTDAPLKYTVEATTTPTGVTLQNAAVGVGETDKVASLQLVVATSELDQDKYTSGGYGNPSTEQQLDQYDASKYEVLKLESGTVTSVESIEKRLAPGNGSGKQNYLLFQFQGTMTRSPSPAWTNADKVSCVVKFTFTPESANDYSLKDASKIVDDSHNPKAFIISNKASDGSVDKVDSSNSKETLSIKLPSTAGTTDKRDIHADSLDTFGAPDFSVSADSPNWTVLSAGGLVKSGVTVNDTNGTVEIAPDACANIPKATGTIAATDVRDYKIVLSFNDEHNIPRTLDFKVALARAAS